MEIFISDKHTIDENGLIRTYYKNGKIRESFGSLDKSTGYLRTSLSKYGPKEYVHRLVGMAFIDNPLNLPQINHKDLNRTNNSVDNLEWVSSSDNIIHSYKNNIRKFCRNGHEMINPYINRKGKLCRICLRKRKLKYYHSNKVLS